MDPSVSHEFQRHCEKADKKLEAVLDVLKAAGVAGVDRAKALLDKTPVSHNQKVKDELLAGVQGAAPRV